MKALITGASSGIGKDMAYYLHSLGHELILVANDKEKLENVRKDIGGSVKIISMDLSIPENCFKLYNLTKRDNIDILINNAGFGAFGEFISTDMDKELNMINVNITAVHILTKLFLQDMVKRNSEIKPFYSNFLDDFLNTGLSAFEDRRGVPALNVKEDEKELALELRVPGMKKEDIHLDYKDGILTISGEKNEEKEEKDRDKYLRREFTSYSFHRSFELPEERYDVAKAQAAYKDGILEVTLPKKEQKDKVSRQIEVK